MNENIFNIIILISLLTFSISSESDINNDTSSDIYYNHTSSEDNLYFVVTTYRHGARYPFVNVDFFGNGIRHKGALTNYGAYQHLEIGKKYRERYSNFLDMNFNPKEMYIRSSDVERTVISTMKELEGLFGKSIGKNFFKIVNNGLSYWNLYTLNNTARQELEKYFGFCDKKKRRLPDISEIFPILQQCYGTQKPPNTDSFCDSVFTAYFEYAYSNKTDNLIGKCGRENADKMYDFCVKSFDAKRGWNEKAAYMFYTMYQTIFNYMFEAIEGKSPLKMVMIGGHDCTVDQFMNFLNGMKIIPRTHYPHYACNIVIELRKYNEEFYLEFYYNDILKYNETLQTFMDILDSSKYSNMYNFCGYPPWIMPEIKTTTIETTKIETTNKKEISTTQKVEETTNKLIPPTTQIVIETTQVQKIPPSTQAKEIEVTTNKEVTPIPTTNIIQENTKKIEEIIKTQKMDIIIPTIYKNEVTTKINEISTTQMPKKETERIEVINAETTIKKEENTDKIKETEIQIEQKNNLTEIIQNQEISSKNSTLKSKLKKFFKKDSDLNLFIVLISIFASIFFIIVFVCLCIYLSKKKKKFIRLSEEQKKRSSKIDNNLSVISVENRKDEKK